MPTLKYIVITLIALALAVYLVMLGLTKFVTPMQNTIIKDIKITETTVNP